MTTITDLLLYEAVVFGAAGAVFCAFYAVRALLRFVETVFILWPCAIAQTLWERSSEKRGTFYDWQEQGDFQ